MEEFYIHARAPFAAYRYFQAGNYRITMPTMPPSAAYGLVLNLAGIEMRTALMDKTTLIKAISRLYSFDSEDTIPSLKIAIGSLGILSKGQIFQQLHTYPVGESGSEKERQKLVRKGKKVGPSLEFLAKGGKYWIIPAKREFITNLNIVIGIQTEIGELKKRIIQGLNGQLDLPRYGLPFAGDNNFLFDSIEVYDEPPEEAYWYSLVQPDEIPETESCRLTVGIDRADNSKTYAPLFARTEEKSKSPPPEAWVWTPKKPET